MTFFNWGFLSIFSVIFMANLLFLQLNPESKIPYFIDEDGFGINESRVIAMYLAQKYDTKKTLVPADIKVQAIIHQRLYFDSGVLMKAFGDAVVSVFTVCNIDGE